MNGAGGSPLEFDVIVVGSGPAGQKAAVQAAKAGKRVVIVEREREIGGACVHQGTIPSKALREQAMRRAIAAEFHARAGQSPAAIDLADVPLPDLLASVGDTVAAHDRYMTAQLGRNGIQTLRGRARFLDARCVDLQAIDGTHQQLTAPRTIICSGSRPRAPEGIPVDHEHVLDSDSLLSMAWLPRSLLVLGGGVIACEYASTFAALGCKVLQADRTPRPLTFMDGELVDYYLHHLNSNGGEYLPEVRIKSVAYQPTKGLVRSEFTDGRICETDKVFIALGRVANIEQLDLAAAGVTLTPAGHVSVDENLQTSAAGIYAAGDVIGPPALASSAMEQGRRAACHALGVPLHSEALSDMPLPSGIYTIPEMSTVGLDEAGARLSHGDILIGRARFGEIARGQICGSPRGMLKLISDGFGRRVLGVQVVGELATELVHVGQMALISQFDVDAFVDTVFNFPTLAEAYRVAALDIVGQRRALVGHSGTLGRQRALGVVG
jgi:NAD(P) transhydrogenase